MITLKDIAREAGVSVMTVSRVVNGQYSKVSEENIRKIQEIIKKRGYIPSSTARSLSSRTSNIISVIVQGTRNEFSRSFYNAAMVGEIVPHVQERGYFLMLHFIDKYDDITHRLRTWNARGAIFIGTFDHDIQKIQEDNIIPLVFTDSYSKVNQINNVGINDYKGGALAAKYFIDKGHRNFAYVGECMTSNVIQQRLKGFKETLEAYGFSLSSRHILDATVVQDPAKAICSFKDQVTAIFVSSDSLAASIISKMRALGRNVPEDYSIIGFDGFPVGNLLTPPLTTISQDIVEKARIAVDILFRHIEKPSSPAENVVLDVQLIERGSVKDLRKQ